MISFNGVRAHAAALIAAAAPFVTDTTAARPMAFVDDGHTNAREDLALLEKGYFASVLPILDGDVLSQGSGLGTAVVDACVPVRVAVSPAGEANIETLVPIVNRALLAFDPTTNVNDRYRLADKAFVADDSEDGQFAYILFFLKRCVL